MKISDYDGIYHMSLQTDGDNKNTTYGDGTASAELKFSNGVIGGVDNHGAEWSGVLLLIDENRVELTLTMDPSNAPKEIISMRQNGELTDTEQTVTHIFNVKRSGKKIMLSHCFDHGGVAVFMTLVKKE